MPLGHAFLAPGIGPVTAVSAWRVAPAQRARALPRQVARGAVTSLSLDGSEALYALCALAAGAECNPIRRLDNAAVVQVVDVALASGGLLLFAGWTAGPDDIPAGGAAAEQTSQDVALIDDIMRGSTALAFEGNRYRFVAPGGPRSPLDRREERPIPLDKARALVAAMVERIPRHPVERAAWQALVGRLAEDEGDDGIRLVLVTFSGEPILPEVASSAVSPSAARAATKTDWIEIAVLYEDGTPYTGNVIVELPDGRRTEGAPNEDGLIRIDGIDPGSCKVAIPDLDGAAWEPA